MYNDIDNLSYSQLQNRVDQNDLNDLKPLRCTVLRNITLEPIEVYWRFLALQIGMKAEVSFGAYDQIFQEAVGGDSKILNEQTDIVFLFLKLEKLSPSISHNFLAMEAEDIDNEKQRIQSYMQKILQGIRRQTKALVIWHTFDVPVNPPLGIFENDNVSSQTACIEELNSVIQYDLKKISSAYCVDMNRCMSRIGQKAFYDARYWHMGQAPYSRAAYKEISKEEFKFVRALRGLNKKCLVLDCDNTLWGGIIGEDGLSNIKLGQTYPGSIYYAFQQTILNLYHKGIILALSSNNDEQDVWDVFQQHPDMVLKKEYIAAAKINWDDKASKIKQLAEELNIGLGHMVFVDDTEVEIDLVRQALPEVETILFSTEKILKEPDLLAASGLFDTLTFSDEDRNRTAMYRSNVTRTQSSQQYEDLDMYYHSLEMEVCISLANEFSLPRIAQLTQRTNQFNLTTQRYTEADIKAFMNDLQVQVLTVSLQDRFGDSGLIGLCIMKNLSYDQMLIDSFMFSCRVLGRKVEDVFLDECMNFAKDNGAKMLQARYKPTAKNNLILDFFKKSVFDLTERNKNDSLFKYDLSKFKSQSFDYIKEIRVALNPKLSEGHKT